MSRAAVRLDGLTARTVEWAGPAGSYRGPLRAFDVPAQPPPDGRHRLPVLLLPGFTGSKEDFGPLVVPLAQAGHRVVAVDLPGQYQSAPAAAHGVDDLAAALLGAGERLTGRGPLHLLGHSFGGLVARAMVLGQPDLAASLTLLSSGPGALTGRRAVALRALRPHLVERGVAATWAELVALGLVEDSEFAAERFTGHALAGLLDGIDALLGATDRTAELAQLARARGIPVLVAHGDSDDAWPPDEQAAMAARLNARHVVLRGAAHSPALETPVTTLAALTAFFAHAEAARAH